MNGRVRPPVRLNAQVRRCRQRPLSRRSPSPVSYRQRSCRRFDELLVPVPMPSARCWISAPSIGGSSSCRHHESHVARRPDPAVHAGCVQWFAHFVEFHRHPWVGLVAWLCRCWSNLFPDGCRPGDLDTSAAESSCRLAAEGGGLSVHRNISAAAWARSHSYGMAAITAGFSVPEIGHGPEVRTRLVQSVCSARHGGSGVLRRLPGPESAATDRRRERPLSGTLDHPSALRCAGLHQHRALHHIYQRCAGLPRAWRRRCHGRAGSPCRFRETQF